MESSTQEISFNKSFVDNTLKQLKTIKLNITEIKNQYIQLIAQINQNIKKNFVNEFDKTIDYIDKYITWLKNLNQIYNDQNIQENINHFNNLRAKYNDLDIKISFLLTPLESMKYSSEKTNITINEIHEFNFPSTKNNSDNNNNNADKTIFEQESFLDSKYHDIYGSKSVINIDNSIDPLTCAGCTLEKGIYHCNHCNSNYCHSCAVSISAIITPHKLEKIDEKSYDVENQKEKFLNTIIKFFKDIIFKCDYILKKGNLNLKDQDTYKKFQFPFVYDENNIINQKSFLEQINDSFCRPILDHQ